MNKSRNLKVENLLKATRTYLLNNIINNINFVLINLKFVFFAWNYIRKKVYYYNEL